MVCSSNYDMNCLFSSNLVVMKFLISTSSLLISVWTEDNSFISSAVFCLVISTTVDSSKYQLYFTFDVGNCQFLSFRQFFWEIFLQIADQPIERFQRLLGLSDKFGFGYQNFILIFGELFLQLGHLILHELLHNCLVPDFPFELIENLAFGVGDHSLHHLILLLHFALFEPFHLSEFLSLPR